MVNIVRSTMQDGVHKGSEKKQCSSVDALLSLLMEVNRPLSPFEVTMFTRTTLVLENEVCGYRSEIVVAGLADAMLPILKGIYLGIEASRRTDVLRHTGGDSPWAHVWALKPLDELAAKLEASTVYRHHRRRAIIMAAFGMTDLDAIRLALLI